ncbi:MAG: WD40/YVTN/BNR-like repeat-containing protein [Halobacteriota archaeon]
MRTAVLGHPDGLTTVDRVDGTDPRVEHHLEDRRILSLATADRRLFVGTFDGGLLRRSGTDGFERVGRDEIDADRITAVAVSPHDPEVVYAGTEPSRLYRSDDGGDSWEEPSTLTEVPSASSWSFPPRPDTHHVRWVEVDPSDPDRLLVGIEAGALLLSEDGGTTWIDRPRGSRVDNHTLATHPDAPGLAYSAAGDGFAESVDGGRGWDHPQDGLEHRYLWGLAVAPDEPEAVTVSAARGASAAHREGRAYCYRRPDRGARWVRLDDPVVSPEEGCYRAVFARAGEDLYAATDRGLARSSDGGATWDRIEAATPDGPIATLTVQSTTR